MTTETDRAQPKAPGRISRIDPALRDAAASLDIVEFRAESLPAERERADRLAAERAAAVDTGSVEIEDRAITGPGDRRLGLRLYRGLTKSAAPLALYAHGGGFVTGNLDTDHPHCVDLARAAGCLVVSVDYRLAPEHPCPAALDDVEAAFRYAVENSARLGADGTRVVVMGRDAGAALAAALAQRMFDQEGPPILAQVLHQPMLDCRRDAVASGISAHAGTQRTGREPRMGPLPRSHRRDGAIRAGSPGELGGVAAGIHQLRGDRPVSRRSHRLRQSAAAQLCTHRIARRRRDISRVRFSGARMGRLPGKRRAARPGASPLVRHLAAAPRRACSYRWAWAH